MAFGYVPRSRGVVGGVYAALHHVTGAPSLLRRLQWPVVRTFLDRGPGQVLLDVGCGDLQLSAELAKAPQGTVIAIDPVSRLARLGYVRARHSRLRLVQGDGTRLPLAGGSVDRVLASSVLQMIPKPESLLRECHRVLRPGGRLVLTVPEGYRYLPRLYNADSWRRRWLGALLGLPREYGAFLEGLNRRFGVQGTGYLSERDLERLLEGAALRAVERRRVPGRLGTLVWETAILLFYRLGGARWPLLLSFVFYPLASLSGTARNDGVGCELVLVAQPIRG
jgi:SAM-dependent methyltransferase